LTPTEPGRPIERAEAPGVRWHAQPDRETLAQVAAASILAAAEDAIASRGRFLLVLAGGETPRAVYARLGAARTDWNAWHIYYGDERCLPADDPGRNSRMAGETWLDHVAIPAAHCHPIPAERGAEPAARAYRETLRAVGAFDLVLLGLGEDGHTASLFPGRDQGVAQGAPDVLAIVDAPKPPAERVSLSAARLSRARQVIVLVAGKSKRDAVARWRAGASIPAAVITPAAGVDVLVESALLARETP
jgi:6-phosphogluconolactonase